MARTTGLRYAAAYPEEIEAALRENRAFDVAALRHLLPGTQVIDIDLDDGSHLLLDAHFSEQDGVQIRESGYSRSLRRILE